MDPRHGRVQPRHAVRCGCPVASALYHYSSYSYPFLGGNAHLPEQPGHSPFSHCVPFPCTPPPHLNQPRTIAKLHKEEKAVGNVVACSVKSREPGHLLCGPRKCRSCGASAKPGVELTPHCCWQSSLQCWNPHTGSHPRHSCNDRGRERGLSLRL